MAAETGKKDFLDELKAMKERMEDIFTRSFDPGADRQERGRKEDEWVPMSDIVDSGTALVYSLDLPGVMEHDIQVECKDDRLYCLTLPLGAVIFSYMILRSTIITLRQGGIVWRDTFYPLDELRRGLV